MMKNLGLKKLELKSKTEETQSNKSRENSRDEVIDINDDECCACFTPMKNTYYLVWDVSGFSVSALDGSTKTVWRIVQ